ncbi:MAG: hypothetical protein ACXVEE_24420 [Polyangiales bacterium]
MRFLLVGLLVVASCKDKPRAELDASRDPVPLAVVDSAPEVERGPDIADALASLEAMEEAGVDAGPAIEATFGTAKVTPKNALDPAPLLARNRFRFRACARSLPDAGSSKVVLTIKVGEGGEVSTVTASDKGPLGDCLRDAAKHVRFEEPTSGSATVEVPVEVVRR